MFSQDSEIPSPLGLFDFRSTKSQIRLKVVLAVDLDFRCLQTGFSLPLCDSFIGLVGAPARSAHSTLTVKQSAPTHSGLFLFPFWSSPSYPDMPWSGTLRKSMFLWMDWFWDGGRGIFWEPSFGKAALGGRFCLCGEEYMTSDGWLAGPLENLAAPFWCAEEAEHKRKTN